MRRWPHVASAVVMTLIASAAALPAGAQTKTGAAESAASATRSGGVPTPAVSSNAVYAERFGNVCAACHGVNGRSDIAGTPVLAGQHSLYAITQLYMFREGRRSNEAMSALGKSMTDADLRGFSEFISTLPPVAAPAPATVPDVARMSKGQALASQYKCVVCHGAALEGGQGVPRLNGQKEEYVRAVLHGYKSGDRPGYTRAMSESLSQVPVGDLDLLAYYVANFTAK